MIWVTTVVCLWIVGVGFWILLRQRHDHNQAKQSLQRSIRAHPSSRPEPPATSTRPPNSYPPSRRP